MTLDLKDDTEFLTFDEVQDLRDLEDKTLALRGHCKSTHLIAQKLKNVSGANFEHDWTLEPYLDRISDFEENFATLTSRVGNTVSLVRDK